MNRDFVTRKPMTQAERDAWLWQQPEWLKLLRNENAGSVYFKSER